MAASGGPGTWERGWKNKRYTLLKMKSPIVLPMIKDNIGADVGRGHSFGSKAMLSAMK